MPNGDTVEVIRVDDGKSGTIPKAKLAAARASGKYKLPSEFPTQFEKERTPEGSSLGRFAKGVGSNILSLLTPSGEAPYPGVGIEGKQASAQQAREEDVQRKAEGRSLPYRAIAGIGGAIAPVSSMEEAARHGDTARMLGIGAGGTGLATIGLTKKGRQLAKESVTKPIKAGAEALEESRIAKSTQEIKKTTVGAKSDFGPDLDRAIQRGYLPEIERQYNPKDVRGASEAVLNTADKLQKNVIQEAINRHPTEMQGGRAVPAVISGDAIAQAILGNIRGIDINLFPKNMISTLREAQRYAGQNIPLKSAADLLEDLNAMDRSLRESAPESAAAARRINRSRAAITTAANSVREQLYNKLSSLGEPQIAEFQKDYGSLRNLGETFRNNIARAEKIGKGPGLTESLFKQHPWYTMVSLLGVGAGSEFGHAGIGAAAGTIPFIRWAMERRGVPNATIERAMSRLGKVSKKPPSIEPPDPFRTGREMGVRGPRRAPFDRQIEEVGPRQALPATPPPLLGPGEQ